MTFPTKVIIISCIVSGLVACAISLLLVAVTLTFTLTWMTWHELSVILFAGIGSAFCLGTLGLLEVFTLRSVPMNATKTVWRAGRDIGLLAGIGTSTRIVGCVIGLAVATSYGRVVGYPNSSLVYGGFMIGAVLGYGAGYLCERVLASVVERRINPRPP